MNQSKAVLNQIKHKMFAISNMKVYLIPALNFIQHGLTTWQQQMVYVISKFIKFSWGTSIVKVIFWQKNIAIPKEDTFHV